MFAITKYLDRFTVYSLANEPADESLTAVFHKLARAISIGQPQGSGADAMDVVIKNMIPLARHLVNAVHVRRVQRMFFIHRQIIWLAILLARPGKDDFHLGIVMPASFQNRQLGATVDLQIRIRVFHAVNVAHLSGEIEDIVHILNQIIHAVLVADVSDIHLDFVFDRFDVEKIAAVLRNEGIDYQHMCAVFYQAMGQVAANKSQAAGDQNVSSMEGRRQGFTLGHAFSPC